MTAADEKSIARNNKALPKNTVAKKRSSRAPRRSRTTPMNQRNAMPTNGIRFNASVTALEFVASQVPGSAESAGTEIRSNPKTATINTENTMPAIAAAFGVRKLVRERESSDIVADPNPLYRYQL